MVHVPSFLVQRVLRCACSLSMYAHAGMHAIVIVCVRVCVCVCVCMHECMYACMHAVQSLGAFLYYWNRASNFSISVCVCVSSFAEPPTAIWVLRWAGVCVDPDPLEARQAEKASESFTCKGLAKVCLDGQGTSQRVLSKGLRPKKVLNQIGQLPTTYQAPRPLQVDCREH